MHPPPAVFIFSPTNKTRTSVNEAQTVNILIFKEALLIQIFKNDYKTHLNLFFDKLDKDGLKRVTIQIQNIQSQTLLFTVNIIQVWRLRRHGAFFSAGCRLTYSISFVENLTWVARVCCL